MEKIECCDPNRKSEKLLNENPFIVDKLFWNNYKFTSLNIVKVDECICILYNSFPRTSFMKSAFFIHLEKVDTNLPTVERRCKREVPLKISLKDLFFDGPCGIEDVNVLVLKESTLASDGTLNLYGFGIIVSRSK